MKIRNKIILLAISIGQSLCMQTGMAQSVTVKTTAPGTIIPDFLIENVVNRNATPVNVSAYRGKLILFDFWNSGCSGCIAAFPKMDSLQKKFNNNLQIYLVNSQKNKDTRRRVDITLNRMKSWFDQPVDLPVIFPDTIITSHFKYQVLPTIAWISPDGIFLGITDEKDVTEENIRSVINHGVLLHDSHKR